MHLLVSIAIKNIFNYKLKNLLLCFVNIVLTVSCTVALNQTNSYNEFIENAKEFYGTKLKLEIVAYDTKGDKYTTAPEENDKYTITKSECYDIADSQYINYAEFIYKQKIDNSGYKLFAPNSRYYGISLSTDNYVLSSTGTIMTVVGYDVREIWEFANGTRKIVDGEMFANNNECIINNIIAENNGLTVGDEITVNRDTSKKMKISGIYSDIRENSDPIRCNEVLTTFDGAYYSVIESDDTPRSHSNFDVMLYLNTYKDDGILNNEINTKYTGRDFVAQMDEHNHYLLYRIIDANNLTSMRFVLIMLIVAVCVVLLISFISLNQRKYEIGVLYSVGMSKKSITVCYVFEYILMIIVAAAVGLAVSNIIAPHFSSIETSVIVFDRIYISDAILDAGSIKGITQIQVICTILFFSLIPVMFYILYTLRFRPMQILRNRN